MKLCDNKAVTRSYTSWCRNKHLPHAILSYN